MSNSEKKFVPVMITPFNLKAKVDFDAVSALIDFYLAAGVKGFFANCLSSEMYSISEDERLELTRHIVRYVKGRVPVVATGSFGLTIEDKKMLFQRFTRLSAQPTAGEHSTGLGLSIVKVLVEAHGGLIFAESEGKDKGSRFTVELPKYKSN